MDGWGHDAGVHGPYIEMGGANKYRKGGGNEVGEGKTPVSVGPFIL